MTRPTVRHCPVCNQHVVTAMHCGIDLTVRRRRWTMTPDKVRAVHVLARARKGLSEEEYRLRLGAVGVSSSKQLGREQFHTFMRGLHALPDAPTWTRRRDARLARAFPQAFGRASS